MISFLHGRIAEKHPTRVVLDVGGVGYEAMIPLSSYDQLPGSGESCTLLTHHHVREDAQTLFGFATEAERAAFRLLMGTTGIGPKLALSALSGLSVRELKVAIVEGDTKRLSSISGIGKKAAERIVVELRDKIDRSDALEALSGSEPLTEQDAVLRDAVMALIALGYKQAEARKLVEAALREKDGETPAVEDVIKMALGRL